ncbi:hypothetical protein BHE74_00035741 [Ensete ventricosum]|nr:hypothetical protein BHE74_00035741 [Ensete ventricosum]
MGFYQLVSEQCSSTFSLLLFIILTIALAIIVVAIFDTTSSHLRAATLLQSHHLHCSLTIFTAAIFSTQKKDCRCIIILPKGGLPSATSFPLLICRWPALGSALPLPSLPPDSHRCPSLVAAPPAYNHHSPASRRQHPLPLPHCYNPCSCTILPRFYSRPPLPPKSPSSYPSPIDAAATSSRSTLPPLLSPLPQPLLAGHTPIVAALGLLLRPPLPPLLQPSLSLVAASSASYGFSTPSVAHRSQPCPPRPLLHSLATIALFLLFPAIYCAIPLYSNRRPCLSSLPSLQSQPQPSLPSTLLPLQPLPAYRHYCCPSYSPSIVDSASSNTACCLSPSTVAVLPRSCTVTVVAVLPCHSPHCCRLHLASSVVAAVAPLCSARSS